MTIQHACSQRDGLEVVKQEVDTCAKEASQLQRCTQCHLYKIGKIALALVSCFFSPYFSFDCQVGLKKLERRIMDMQEESARLEIS